MFYKENCIRSDKRWGFITTNQHLLLFWLVYSRDKPSQTDLSQLTIYVFLLRHGPLFTRPRIIYLGNISFHPTVRGGILML